MPIGSKASPMMTPETIPLRNINVIGSMLLPYFLCDVLVTQCLNLIPNVFKCMFPKYTDATATPTSHCHIGADTVNKVSIDKFL